MEKKQTKYLSLKETKSLIDKTSQQQFLNNILLNKKIV